MAKGNITALAVSPGLMSWTSMRMIKNHLSVVDSQNLEFGIPGKLDADGAKEVSDLLKSKCHGLRGSVTLGLTSEQLLLRVIDFPTVDEDELTSMVELQVDKFSPFPVENMVVSHETLKQEGGMSSVLVAVAQKDIVESLGNVLRTAGILVDRVDAQALGWWYLLKNAQVVSEHDRQVLLIMDGAIPEIIVAENSMPIAFRSLGDISSLQENEISEDIAREIGHTLMSLEMEYGEADRSFISICSRTGRLPEDLLESLRSECSCDVNKTSIASLPQLSEGLAQRSTEGARLDLSPNAWHIAGESKEFKKRFAMVACIFMGLWLAVVGGFLGLLYFQKQQLIKLNNQIEVLQEPALGVSNMRGRVRVINRYMDRTHSPLECIRELSNLQPKGIDLTSLSYQKGTQIKIIGEAMDVNLVYDFSNKLNKSPLFKKTVLHGPRYDRRKRKQVFDVEIHLPGDEES